MALSNKTKKRVITAFTDKSSANELTDLVDGITDGTVKVPAKVITTDTTYYIDVALGNDTTGDGSQAKPWAQIQTAINFLQDYEIRAIVTISVAAGTYDGFYLAGLKFTYATTSATASPGLLIQGATVAPTLASGTASGVTTASTSGVLNDTTQNWPVNGLAGQICEFMVSTTVFYAVVISNTATQAVLSTTSTPSTGLAYSFYLPATNITGNKGFPGSTASASTSSAIILGHISCFGNSQIRLQNLAASVSSGRCVYTTSPSALAAFSRCTFNGTSTNVGFITLDGSVSFTGCKFTSAFTTTAAIISTGTTTTTAALQVSQCYFKNATVNGVALRVNGGRISATLSYFENFAVAGDVQFVSGTANMPAGLSLSGSWVNCTTVLSALRGDCWGSISTPYTHVPPSGNTNGVVLSRGGTCAIISTAVLGATNELSVDGVVGTLAALRAASPKTFPTTPNIYGTLVYE